MTPLSIVGRGKVGVALAGRARRAGLRVRALSARDVLSGARVPASEVLIIAARDAEIARVAAALVGRGRLPRVALHCAGALGPDALSPLAQAGVAVAAAHPLASFSGAASTQLAGAALVIEGAPAAVAAARALAARLGMLPVVVGALDRAAYHAAAALVANGAAALVAVGARLLASAGVPAARAPSMLAALLASVASNVDQLGPIRALSGPVRRGDARAVARHLGALSADPEAEALYRALARAQLAIVRQLSDADEPGVEGRDDSDLEALVRGPGSPSGSGPGL